MRRGDCIEDRGNAVSLGVGELTVLRPLAGDTLPGQLAIEVLVPVEAELGIVRR